VLSLDLDVSVLQLSVPPLDAYCLFYCSLCCPWPWTCVFYSRLCYPAWTYTAACATWTYLFYGSLCGPWTCTLCSTAACVAPGCVCFTANCAALDVYILRQTVLPWTYLFYGSLCCPWACLFYSILCYLGRICSTAACAAPGCVCCNKYYGL
jgi:hypothetical protein